MSLTILPFLESRLKKSVSATGLGAFRIGYSLVLLQEIVFLFYFRHLIFDPVPYLDRASPVLHTILLVWMGVAICLLVGYRTRYVAVANYLLWIIFVVFTPMWQDFDGGFDQLMTGSGFLLIFLPSERAFSLDTLRRKWHYASLGKPYTACSEVSVLSYLLTVGLSLGLLYFDSGLHKLSAEFWRNGLGAWLPPTMPYYVSPIDMSFLLNLKVVEQCIGYTILIFQLSFLFLFWSRLFRVPLLILGVTFHTGIILSLNVYPFGFAMLVHYFLLVPFSWWRAIGSAVRCTSPTLTIFYDELCPLCRRTVVTIMHFDSRLAVECKGLQTFAKNVPELHSIAESELLRDVYALDENKRIYRGINTYIRILIHMGYTAPIGYFLLVPGIYQLAERTYRNIADTRQRELCNEATCLMDNEIQYPAVELDHPFSAMYIRYAHTDKKIARRIFKFCVLIVVLQLNSTVHYAILYRWVGTRPNDPFLSQLDQLSDAIINLSHTFFGISPHALYMHDHFQGYRYIISITYQDLSGEEKWLPFVNEDGRLLSPNWGRIQSMWANVAVTKHLDPQRLEKFIRKITAYYSVEEGLDLSQVQFIIKLREISAPMTWEHDLRRKNRTAPWEDIGTAIWEEGGMHIDLSGLDSILSPGSFPALNDQPARDTMDSTTP